MVGERLFHISEERGITVFEPRPPTPGLPYMIDEPVVWAIGERLLHNYLLPRACPRVTYYAGPDTSAADRARFINGAAASHIVAIEADWIERIRQAKLYEYEMDPAGFDCIDPIAAYHISRSAQAPIACREIPDVLTELSRRDVELRTMPSVLELQREVAASTLAFSCIRMRNAR